MGFTNTPGGCSCTLRGIQEQYEHPSLLICPVLGPKIFREMRPIPTQCHMLVGAQSHAHSHVLHTHKYAHATHSHMCTLTHNSLTHSCMCMHFKCAYIYTRVHIDTHSYTSAHTLCITHTCTHTFMHTHTCTLAIPLTLIESPSLVSRKAVDSQSKEQSDYDICDNDTNQVGCVQFHTVLAHCEQRR